MKTKAAAKFFSLPLQVNLPIEVYGVGEGVAEGSTDGLGVAVPDGVGVGETWVPRNDAGYDDPSPNHNDFRAGSVLDLRSAQ